jgi:hypothetical protein
MYESLEDIPVEIREFYEVVENTVCLIERDKVLFTDVAQSVGLRHSRAVIDATLRKAIEWDYFVVNHDGYLSWVEDLTAWEQEQLENKDNEEFQPTTAPVRPVIDIERYREFYQVIITSISNLENQLTTYVDAIDDDLFIINRVHDTEPKPKDEIDKIKKLEGIEFNGVKCSATKEDMWGLSSVESLVRSGTPINFNFDSGETLLLTPENIDGFQAVWVPFRMSFFYWNQPNLTNKQRLNNG